MEISVKNIMINWHMYAGYRTSYGLVSSATPSAIVTAANDAVCIGNFFITVIINI
jgi:hypothetical protein